MIDLSADFLYRQFWVPLKPVPPIYDLKNETFIMTGASSGMGVDVAKQLVTTFKLGHLIIGARNAEKGKQIQKELQESASAKCKVEVWPLDLESFESIAGFCSRAEELKRLDQVILNAGIKPIAFTKTVDGHEVTSQVNHLSTALLSLRLLETLKKSAKVTQKPGRLVVVSSEVHFWTPFEERHAPKILERMDESDSFSMPWRYNTSKLFNVLWCRDLAENTKSSEVVINNVNPGLCWTQLHRDDSTFALWAFRCLFARPAIQGAYAILDAALAQDSDSHGCYLSEERITKTADFVRSKEGRETQERLRIETLDILKKYLQ